MNLAQKAKYHGLYCAVLGYVSMREEANIKLVDLVGEFSIWYACMQEMTKLIYCGNKNSGKD
jgi:hypothetical protein